MNATKKDLVEIERAELERLRAATSQVAVLKEEIQQLKDIIFGRKSEKITGDDSSNEHHQLGLFGAKVIAPPEPEQLSVPAHKRAKRKGREEIPAHLPREEVVIDVPAAERSCELCDAEMVPFQDAVTERVKVIPAKAVVIRTIRKQYRCPDGHCMACAPTPPELLPKSKYDTSVAVHVVIAKYLDHLPLHRQMEIFRRVGIKIPKSTLCDLVMRAGELLKPIQEEMERELLEATYLQSDDTPIQVLEEGKKGSRQGHMWIYRHEHIVVFRFSYSRGRDGPLAFLGSWKGHLQTDGLTSYDAVVQQNELTHHGCWAHARRKFHDAFKVGAPRASAMIELINKLFEVEREVRGAESVVPLVDRLRTARQERSLKILNEIEALLGALQQDKEILPRSVLGKALTYLDRQWPGLVRFIDAPEVMIHNNSAERAIRAIALGRKNWLFAGSSRGAEVAATLYSILGTCKVLNVPADQYLTDVLERLIAKKPGTKARDLTPWAWAKARDLPLPTVAEPSF